jgi:hypothetical protein
MGELLRGRHQSAKGNAAHWLQLFNAAYSRKLQMPVYPGSLNVALEHTFDWFAVRCQAHIIWFGREEYGGERDILLLPCELVDFERRKAFLWTPTTAARSRPDPPGLFNLFVRLAFGTPTACRTATYSPLSSPCKITAPNQSMKPTAPFRNKFSVFATTPCRGLSSSR